MKTEIDLRPPEFSQVRRNLRFRLAAGFFLITAAGFALLSFTLLESRIEKLHLQLEELRKSNQILAEQTAPLEQLAADIKALEEKAHLEAALREQRRPYSKYLHSIITALPESFCLNTVTIDERGQLTINGSGPAMPEIAAYNQMLSRFSFIGESTISTIDLDPSGQYRFIINAALR